MTQKQLHHWEAHPITCNDSQKLSRCERALGSTTAQSSAPAVYCFCNSAEGPS
ncbi:hypothetical protein I79_002930 [Cricetulus griseus]|uniref:Uncharacterized protein n=1 Tax=Cricetulus griseus TaxID=10029 RepID=G3GYM5_CRIGR|nr:hypothetical protein I79_002930 [Cricetulus griseus]